MEVGGYVALWTRNRPDLPVSFAGAVLMVPLRWRYFRSFGRCRRSRLVTLTQIEAFAQIMAAPYINWFK
jgi:hypothetical protein